MASSPIINNLKKKLIINITKIYQIWRQRQCVQQLFGFWNNIIHFSCFEWIFPQFWLAKSTCIIHHNQLLMTKFGKILCLTRKWRQTCSLLQVNAPITEKTWGRGWVVFFVKTKMGHLICVVGHFLIHTGPTPSLTPQTMLDTCIQNFFPSFNLV